MSMSGLYSRMEGRTQILGYTYIDANKRSLDMRIRTHPDGRKTVEVFSDGNLLREYPLHISTSKGD